MSKKFNFYALFGITFVGSYLTFTATTYAQCVPVAGIIFRCPLIPRDTSVVLFGGVHGFPSSRVVQLLQDRPDVILSSELANRLSLNISALPDLFIRKRLNFRTGETIREVVDSTNLNNIEAQVFTVPISGLD